MPVDPLEEARERLRRWASDLERRAADHSMGTCDPTYEGPTRGDRAVMVNQAALFRTILAELDRRSPPTREGDWVLVPREPTEAMLAPYRGVNRIRDTAAGAANTYRGMLAAAPPPPDVSRGLDREEVARLIDPYAFRPEATQDHHDRAYRDKALTKADAIIALSAPPPTDKPE